MCASNSRLIALILFVFASTPLQAHDRVVAPNGGEVFVAASTVTVTWTIVVQHVTQNWDLWYSVSGANGPWIPIVIDLPTMGSIAAGTLHSYQWVVPNLPTTQARIRVRQDNAGFDYEDVSDADFSIVSSPLVASPSSISVSSGGVQSLSLDAGVSHASENYWLAGSLTGTTPGLTVGSVTIPLVPDAWFEWCLLYPNVGPLGNTMGSLDANGQATATITLPAGLDPGLSGLTVWHAFAAWTPGQLPSFASPAVSLTLVP